MIPEVCFNCKHKKLVDGSFDGGIIRCLNDGSYHYLEEPGCDGFEPRPDLVEEEEPT